MRELRGMFNGLKPVVNNSVVPTELLVFSENPVGMEEILAIGFNPLKTVFENGVILEEIDFEGVKLNGQRV